jgi:hypothetical protein
MPVHPTSRNDSRRMAGIPALHPSRIPKGIRPKPPARLRHTGASLLEMGQN